MRCKAAGLRVVAGGPLFTSEHEESVALDPVPAPAAPSRCDQSCDLRSPLSQNLRKTCGVTRKEKGVSTGTSISRLRFAFRESEAERLRYCFFKGAMLEAVGRGDVRVAL